MAATQAIKDLVELYKGVTIEFPQLKPVSLAKWILESGRGTSRLAIEFNNFAGMKWRREMQPFANPVTYEAHDGVGTYCHFHTPGDFIKGYWAFLDRSPYKGWRDHVSEPEGFIGFVGPIWAESPRYVEKVIDLIDEATDLLGSFALAEQPGHMHGLGLVCEGCGEDELGDVGLQALALSVPPVKPVVDRFESTSHQSSRNGTDIDHIVIHYTTSRNINGTINHFKNGSPRTSAHYIVGQDGALVQMVKDKDRAWHAGSSSMNARSIGIEHVAASGDKISSTQAEKSAALIRWLMHEYDIPKSNIIAHVCVKPTSCPGDLFKDLGGGAGTSCGKQGAAIAGWLTSAGIA